MNQLEKLNRMLGLDGGDLGIISNAILGAPVPGVAVASVDPFWNDIRGTLGDFEYTHSDIVDPPEDWQLEDLEQMYNHAIFRGYCANWSEMGAKKTSTGLWLIQRLWKEFWPTTRIDEDSGATVPRHPNVWACTTRSGKGTFFKLGPQILEGWYFFNITAQGVLLLDNETGEFQKLKLDKIPDYFDMPTFVVTHFNTFSKSNHNRFMETDDGTPIKNPDGSLAMYPPTFADHFVKRLWDLSWIDESHRIKGKDTKWTVVLKRSKDEIRMDTTGTGFINRPDEVWSLGDHMTKSRIAKANKPDIDPVKAEFGGYWDFREEFCLIDEIAGFEKVIGINPERKDDFRRIIRELGPRRTLSEVMPHLKEPLFDPHEVDLNPIQRRMYNQIMSELQAIDQNGKTLFSANILAMLQRLRAICVATPEVVEEFYDEKTETVRQKIKLVEPSSKLDEIMEILDGLSWDEDRKDQVVIFSNFVGPLLLLEARFEKANQNALEMGFEPEYPYLWMKESHSDEQRYNMWKPNGLFESGEYRVFMSTLQLGGESISLTAARHVIFLDRSWSPKDNSQGIGRIKRPGQEGQPIVVNINAKDTVDTYIKGVNDLKQGWFKEIFGK